jgi:hypothetical protein
MHYPQTNRDALNHLSQLPYFESPETGMGQYMEAAMMAMEAMDGGSGGANTNTGEGMPGGNQSVPRQPSANATVSSAVVTQVSPQISPVMTQQQSSPGATVGANPMQFMPGGLSADQAMTPYGNQGAPGFPTNQPGISPYQPYGMDPRTGGYMAIDPMTGQPISTSYSAPGGGGYSPVSVGGSSMQNLPWIPIAIVGGAVGLALLLKKKRRNGARR